MNALNLRISSVKTGENIRKNAEMRTSLVVLPREYIEAFYCKERDEFLCAKSIQDQVEFVKSSYQLAKENPDLLEFLFDLFFLSPTKHPVRNQLLRYV